MKEELHVFTDVISPHTHTREALKKALSLADYDHPNNIIDGNVIQLFNKAGFETTWISNQNPIGYLDNAITHIAKSSDHVYFSNVNETSENESLDEKILPLFEEALQQNYKKKLIIIHLMGTHAIYSNRYPQEFNLFQSPNPTQKEATINAYDNAVLYNDHIISELINTLKKFSKTSSMLYLSDHGEDVYETIDKSCHSETIGSIPMFKIPFILWLSENYKLLQTQNVYMTNNKYITEDLLFTMADLGGITFKEHKPTKSIINKDFSYKKRIILHQINYDELN